MEILKLRNEIKNYAWGSPDAIPGILGIEPTGEPMAEYWMGVHPQAPSKGLSREGEVPLDQLIARAPAEVLGPRVAKTFDNKLPFLFKILAAARPLSIQAHPTRARAEEGFEKEKNLPRDAYNLTYKDPNHKPEIICALTPFRALCGFMAPEKLVQAFRLIDPSFQREEWLRFRRNPGETSFRDFFKVLMTLPEEEAREITRRILSMAEKQVFNEEKCTGLIYINSHFPEDRGIISAFLLNFFTLQPGEALFLPPGHLHAYLEGVGIELMANSDNVLRGGLTPKYINVDELLSILDFRYEEFNVITPCDGGIYKTPAEEFELMVINLQDQQDFHYLGNQSISILLCTEGSGNVIPHKGEEVSIKKGESLVIPGSLYNYTLQGTGQFFQARVPG